MPVPILMPALSPTMTHGNLVKWGKKEGDKVVPGDIIAEIETDKATMEVEAVDEGVLARILVPAGTDSVAVNQVIAFIVEEGETWDEKSVSSLNSSPEVSKISSEGPRPQKEIKSSSLTHQEKGSDRLFASPLARRLASLEGIDLKLITGSGPRGRIVKEDVEKAKSQGVSGLKEVHSPTALLPVGSYEEKPLSGMRKVIAQRLTESKQTIPHFYLTVSCEIDELLRVRKQLNEISPQKISVNDFVIKAVALALMKVPAANSSWAEGKIRHYHHADISVAVAIEGGLITPILRQAEMKTLSQISCEMKELAGRAKEGKLMPEEYQGGSFSLSNLGMYGVETFQAIINPPQGCILAVGAGLEKPVVRHGKIEVGTVMDCTLSVDHRVVDGAVGAQFLAELKKLLTHPLLMLV